MNVTDVYSDCKYIMVPPSFCAVEQSKGKKKYFPLNFFSLYCQNINYSAILSSLADRALHFYSVCTCSA